jgi:hypothetical protein
MALAGFFNALLAIAGLLAFGTLLGLAMIWTGAQLSAWGARRPAAGLGRGGRRKAWPPRKSETHSTIN